MGSALVRGGRIAEGKGSQPHEGHGAMQNDRTDCIVTTADCTNGYASGKVARGSRFTSGLAACAVALISQGRPGMCMDHFMKATHAGAVEKLSRVVTLPPVGKGAAESQTTLLDGHQPPQVGSEEASSTAAFKLRLLLRQLDKGTLPSISDLKKTISYAADVLTGHSWEGVPRHQSSVDRLQDVGEKQVRAWLATTFTKQESVYEQPPFSKPPTFKTVVRAVIIGQHIDRESTVYAGPQYPPGLAEVFQKKIDSWNFDIFEVEALADSKPLRFVGYELFQRYNFLKQFKISPSCLDAFLCRVEQGYKHHGNAYHNATHGADVLQTVHYLVHTTGLEQWFCELELLALLLAAAIHDVNHTGTTNTFHIQSYSEYALWYNDRSVLENHHLYYAFKLLKEHNLNILRELEEEEFRTVRGLVIDMVLGTDMSGHFGQLEQMRMLMSAPDAVSQLSEEEQRSKVLCLLLHMADISHPGKPWQLHQQWTSRLMEEFFQQGDKERERGVECSPLCDRNNTLIPESQLGFIDYIVGPSFEVCGDLLSLLLSCPSPTPGDQQPAHEVWPRHLRENRERWKAQCEKKGDDRPSTMNGQESNHSNHGNTPGNTVKQKKQSTVETHTVSTVELCQTPGGSETKTIRTVETRTVTTDEATVISKKGQVGQLLKNISDTDT